MVDGISKIASAFIAVIILFIWPLNHLADNQENAIQLMVLNETTQLVDSVRDKGYLDGDMYDAFLDSIAATGCGYNVSLSHRHKNYYPIYTDINDPDSFTGDYEVVYEGYFTSEIKSELHNSGIYYFNKDDYFLIEITNTTQTFAGQLKSLVFGGSRELPSIFVKYGGQIRYENY